MNDPENRIEFLGNSRRRSKYPILEISQVYFGKLKESFAQIEFKGQIWSVGTGISPVALSTTNCLPVLKKTLPEAVCLHCDSANVLVIALASDVHPFSGDAYYDFEIVCENCHQFSAYSYAEN